MTGDSGFPCAMGYGLFRALAGETRLACHRLAKMLRISRETPAARTSGPHDFAVRIACARQSQRSASTASRPTFVTTAIRPSILRACAVGQISDWAFRAFGASSDLLLAGQTSHILESARPR